VLSQAARFSSSNDYGPPRELKREPLNDEPYVPSVNKHKPLRHGKGHSGSLTVPPATRPPHAIIPTVTNKDDGDFSTSHQKCLDAVNSLRSTIADQRLGIHSIRSDYEPFLQPCQLPPKMPYGMFDFDV
jgi:hypothetical protein